MLRVSLKTWVILILLGVCGAKGMAGPVDFSHDPRHGTATEIGTFPRQGTREFKPSIHGKGNDWVLVLDDAAREFPAPGQVD